ncbi:MAG: 2-aminoethylphosphonate aminotransferase [Caldisericia bacterium]|nr:2-aminoethylphosphonate aminotransferase [Caldisericia bacterium]
MKKTLLFNPGPTNVSERVRNAIKTKDICHREKEFSEVLQRVRETLLKVVNGQKTHTAVAFVSSATGCNEAVLCGIRGKVLLINNGKYSERLKKIIQLYKIPFIELKVDQFKELDLDKFEKTLKKNLKVTHIVFVHHETTTGMVMPLDKIGRLAKKYGKIICVDAVSSLGGYKIDVKKDNIAFCTVSSNKCLESFPGISFVIADKSELNKIEGKSRSFYFDLYNQWQSEEKGCTLFTPAVQLFFAIDKALKELVVEGVDKRIERYKKNAERMRAGLKKLGFKFILSDNLQSNIITAIRMPKSMNYWRVHDLLKELGHTIYSGKSTLDQGIFRIATLGHLKKSDIDRFLKDFKKVLQKVGLKLNK